MLRLRIITALVLVLVFGAVATMLPPFAFSLLAGAVILCAGWEWSRLVGLESAAGRLLYVLLLALAGGLLLLWLGIGMPGGAPHAARVALLQGLGLLFWILVLALLLGYPRNRSRWDGGARIGAMGLCALLPSLAGISYLKYLLPAGYLALALVLMVAAVDIGAYFVGRRFGRTKLAPALSPKKSWEGVWGGLAVCLAMTAALAWAMHVGLRPLGGGDLLLLILLALALCAYCVIGDLLESMLKRNRQTKDSGRLLPGHGGLLDRVDGLLAATPVFALAMMFFFGGSGEQ